jgi:hypothetical protein
MYSSNAAACSILEGNVKQSADAIADFWDFDNLTPWLSFAAG